jgi:RimJ/RimL family protein N-acetyltransferase
MIREATLIDIAYVVSHARQEDIQSIRAFYTGELDSFAARRFENSVASWTLENGGLPVAVGGIAEVIPGVGHGWFISTPKAWPSFRCKKQILIAMHQACTRFGEAGFHRLQAQCLDTEGAVRLLEHLGFRFEGSLRCGGAGKEDLLNYGMVAHG